MNQYFYNLIDLGPFVVVLLLLLFVPYLMSLLFYRVYLYNGLSFLDSFFITLYNKKKIQYLMPFRLMYVIYFFKTTYNQRLVILCFSGFFITTTVLLKLNIFFIFLNKGPFFFSPGVFVILALLASFHAFFRIFINYSLLIIKKLYNLDLKILESLDSKILLTKGISGELFNALMQKNSVSHFHPNNAQEPINTWTKAGIIFGGIGAIGTISATYIGYHMLQEARSGNIIKQNKNDALILEERRKNDALILAKQRETDEKIALFREDLRLRREADFAKKNVTLDAPEKVLLNNDQKLDLLEFERK